MTLGGHSRWQRSLGAGGRVSRLREVAKALGFLGGGVPRAPQSPRALPPQERRPFSEPCTAASESSLTPRLLSFHPGPSQSGCCVPSAVPHGLELLVCLTGPPLVHSCEPGDYAGVASEGLRTPGRQLGSEGRGGVGKEPGKMAQRDQIFLKCLHVGLGPHSRNL